MTDADAQNIIDAVRDFSNGTNTTEAAVVELARRCKNLPFTIHNASAGLPNPRRDYHVGKTPGETIGGRSYPPRLQFSTSGAPTVESTVPIPSVFSVLMIPATDLLIKSRTSRILLIKTPTLETFQFGNGQYVALNLDDAPANSLVLTCRLSGCTFAVGCASTKLYLGHAQPIKNIPFAEDGLELGKSIRKMGTAIFEGVAENELQSMFLIRRGKEFAVKDSGIKYARPSYANVLGLLRDKKLYFIVTITSGASQVDVEKVFLLSPTTSHGWHIQQM